jgi:hypothetical protein
MTAPTTSTTEEPSLEEVKDTSSNTLSDFFNHVFSLSAEDADAMVTDINDQFRTMLRTHKLESSMEEIENFYHKHRVMIDVNDPYMDDAGNVSYLRCLLLCFWHFSN